MEGKVFVTFTLSGVEGVTYQISDEQGEKEVREIMDLIGGTLRMADLVLDPLRKKKQINLSDRKENLN